MAFRTYAWFYGSDYQLINIYDAREKDHPYYADETLYGATDVHSFSTYNFIREVTRRVVVSTDKATQGSRKVYEKGTPEWNQKFNVTNKERHSNEMMYEEYIERPDGWFEFELPLGFMGVDLFEAITTAKPIVEIDFVVFAPGTHFKLSPQYQFAFQYCLISSYEIVNSFTTGSGNLLRCKAQYAEVRFDDFENMKTDTFQLRSYELDEIRLANGKHRVFHDKKHSQILLQREDKTLVQKVLCDFKPVTLHHISVAQQNTFYGHDMKPGELDELFFHIAPEPISVDDFINNLYETPKQEHKENLIRTNPHIVSGYIQTGQLIIIIYPLSNLYQKIGPNLRQDLQAIDMIHKNMNYVVKESIAGNFALLGSFAPALQPSMDGMSHII